MPLQGCSLPQAPQAHSTCPHIEDLPAPQLTRNSRKDPLRIAVLFKGGQNGFHASLREGERDSSLMTCQGHEGARSSRRRTVKHSERCSCINSRTEVMEQVQQQLQIHQTAW